MFQSTPVLEALHCPSGMGPLSTPIAKFSLQPGMPGSIHCFLSIILLPPAHPRWPKAFFLTPDSPSPVLHSCWSPAPVRATTECVMPGGCCARGTCALSLSCGLSHSASCSCSKWAKSKGRRALLWTDSSPALIFSYPRGPWSWSWMVSKRLQGHSDVIKNSV